MPQDKIINEQDSTAGVTVRFGIRACFLTVAILQRIFCFLLQNAVMKATIKVRGIKKDQVDIYNKCFQCTVVCLRDKLSLTPGSIFRISELERGKEMTLLLREKYFKVFIA